MVPGRAGSDTRVDVQFPLSALREMPGAPAVEEAWLRARAGQSGGRVITQMLTLITSRRNHAGGPEPPGDPVLGVIRREHRWAVGVIGGVDGVFAGFGLRVLVCDDSVGMSDTGRPSP